MAGGRLQRRLAAILSADVVGYSRLMGVDEAGTLARLQDVRSEIIDPTISAHSGRTIKLMGDGALVEFASVVDAVACALEIQKSVRDRNSVGPEHQSIQFRIGINVGDVIVDGDDIYGDGVNVAARIEALADPGAVYLARAAADEVRDKLPIRLEPRGERRVKNVARPIEVFRASLAESGADSFSADDSGIRSPASRMPWPPETDRDRAPYRGLKALETVDAGIFFGRDAAIAEGIERIRWLRAIGGTRLLVVLGASGAGKSSFLRAGILPQLEADGRHFVPLPVIRPERAALFGENGLLGALETALSSRARAEIRAAIREGADGVRRLLLEFRQATASRTCANEPPAEQPVVVMAIDQAEELFRVEGADESEALLNIIRDLATQDQVSVIVIFAIRSDSYDALQRARPLEGLPQSTTPLLPMPKVSYKEVIEGPARRFVAAGGKLAVEPQLTLRLLEDIDKSGSGDALPLLAFTLEQLFLEYGRAGALRLAYYQEFGGLRGAINAAVERALARADADLRIPRDRKAREALLRRGLVPWLAGIDPDTKSPRRNISRRQDIPAEALPLIDLLVEERLLSTDAQVSKDAVTGEENSSITIEPAHEALLRQWSLLEGWLSEDFALLAALEGIKRAARDWEANGMAEGWLAHQGQRLAEAGTLDARPDLAAQFEDRDRAYLDACSAREAAAAAERERARLNELARAKAETERAQAEAERAKARERFSRNLTLVSIAAAILLAGVGVWAWQQRNAAIDQRRNADLAAERAQAATTEAVAQRNRAESAVKEAIDASNTLVSSMVQKLRNVAGMKISLVQAILEPALSLQDKLISAGETSPELRRSQAAALVEAGRTQLAVGDTDSAFSSAKRSRDIMLALVAARPDSADWKIDLSNAYVLVGNVQEAQGRLLDAARSYSDNLTVIDELARSDPDNQAWRRLLSKAHTLFGGALLKRGRLPEALAEYEKSLAIIDRLAKADPGSSLLQSELSDVYYGLSDVQDAQGRIVDTLQYLARSLDLIDHLAKADPSNTLWQRLSAARNNRLVETQIRHGDVAAAMRASTTSIATIEGLARADPANTSFRQTMSVSYMRAGDVQRWRIRFGEALQSYSRAAEIREKIVQSDPRNNITRRDLAYSQLMVGEAQIFQDRAADGLQSYSSALATLKELAVSDANNANWQRDLARAYEHVGEAQMAQSEPAKALQSYSTAITVLNKLIDGDPDNVGWQEVRAYFDWRKGDAETDMGDFAEALDLYSNARDIRLRLVPEGGEDRQNQFSLALIYKSIGNVLLKQGKADSALNSYASGLEIFKSLADINPENALCSHALATTHFAMAQAYESVGDSRQANAAMKADREIMVKLVEDHPDLPKLKTELAEIDEQIAAYER